MDIHLKNFREQIDDFMGSFPLVFPNSPDGEAKKAKLLTQYDRMGR